MKKIKKLNLIMVLVLIWSIFGTITNVFAASATVGFSGNSTVKVGSNITVTMYISNVTDAIGGVVSAGGNLSFESEYLEYVSGTGATSPYTFQINTGANYKIAGLDTTLSNGITSQTTVFTFVFKAKKAGTTQVTLTDAKLSDTANKLTTNVSAKSITITEDSSTTPTDPTPSDPTPDTPTTPTKSSDATLKSLSASGYTLSPTFSSSTTSYTVTVPASATIVKLEGKANDSKATITGLGNVTLTGDTTTATVKVKAEDGKTTKEYTVKIVKEAEKSEEVKKDGDATLKSLSVSGYTLSPTFKKNVNTYSMKVKNNITGLDVTAIPNSDKATVTISGNKNWKEGVNVVTIKVTAEDGTVNTYTVNVTRESSDSGKTTTTTTKSSDNYLKDLIINSSHEISPKFDKDVSNYNINVPYEVDKLDLQTVLNNSKAKVEITGNENFKAGEVNTVQITVTAEDGTKRIYTLNVTRTTQTSDNDLKDIIIGGVDLDPKFDPDVLEYNVKVDADTDELDITAIAENSDAKVEIIGNKNLKEGHNTVLIKVTDKNGFSKFYTIDVEKEAKEETILGLKPHQFWIIAGILGATLLTIGILSFLLLRKKKDKKGDYNKQVTPIIEVKPEFNFGSKNTSDDDVVHGNLNQNSHVLGTKSEPTRTAIEADYEESIPYDPYDMTVTKREIVDAIREATKTKDPSKLKMLLEQDELNQRKKEIKRREEELREKELEDEDNWRY